MPTEPESEQHGAIELPAPTAWPLVAAFGLTLGFAGLVTNAAVSAVGVVAFAVGAVGWWRDVLPHARHEGVPVRPLALRARPVAPAPQAVQHLLAEASLHRMRLPVEIHPYSAGVLGGLVGGVAMAALAIAFGLLSHGSPWYPINLLAAAAMPSLATADTAELVRFSASGLLVASIVHGAMSLLVGLLYGVILPMFARHPAIVGGFVGPLLWTGLAWAGLGVINPALDARIEWGWFIASQIGFGLTAGFVVHRSERIATMQALPLSVRAGLEAPGLEGREEHE